MKIVVIITVLTNWIIYAALAILACWLILEFFIWRAGILARKKRETLDMQMQYARLEDKALRAQMNPHFIFNSLNSIKLLVQENENNKAIYYLTTFTRLLRNVLENADKNTIRLFDELETCKLYLQLENLRFNNEIQCHFSIDPALDLKTIDVPTLVLQPFIENAIWHGLMPKTGDRQLNISIKAEEDHVVCLIDDNGIGRDASLKNAKMNGHHNSKGLQLTKERIQLMDKLHDTDTHLTIRDKFSVEGASLGTQVEIKFLMHEPVI
jgi:LytS/YehU family sensor histidine kinase